MFVRLVGIGLGLVHGSVDMLGRTINGIKPQSFAAAAYDVVPSALRHDNSIVSFDPIAYAVDPHLALARLDSEELVTVLVHFLSDFLARPQRHQHELDVMAG